MIDSGVNVIVDGVNVRHWRSDRHDRHLGRSAGDLDHRPQEPDLKGRTSRTSGRRWSSTWRATSSSARASGSSMPTGCTTTCRTTWARSSTPTCSRRCRTYQGLLRLHADVVQQTGPGPFLRRKRASSLPAAWASRAIGSSGRRLLRGPPAAGGRSVDRPAAGRSGDRPAGHRAPAAGHGGEQFPLHRAGAGLLLADDRHRPERPDLLHPPRRD